MPSSSFSPGTSRGRGLCPWTDIHSFELQKDLYKALGAGLGYHIYDRIGNYEDYPRVSILNQEFRLLATLAL